MHKYILETLFQMRFACSNTPIAVGFRSCLLGGLDGVFVVLAVQFSLKNLYDIFLEGDIIYVIIGVHGSIVVAIEVLLVVQEELH